jgi:hypothetical protein
MVSRDVLSTRVFSSLSPGFSHCSKTFCSGTSKLGMPSRSASFSRCLILRLPEPSKTSSPSALAQAACANVTPRSLCPTKARDSTESSPNSCARAEISPTAMAPAARVFTEKSLPTKLAALLCPTMSSTCCRWPTPAPTPTAASSSSPLCPLLTSTANTLYSARCVSDSIFDVPHGPSCSHHPFSAAVFAITGSLLTFLSQVVKGQKVVDDLESVPKKGDTPSVPCIIYDCGRMTHEEGLAAIAAE